MGNKIKVSVPQVNLPVLPPVQEVLSWFGLSSSLAEAIQAIAAQKGVKSPADPKTLRKIATSGISPRKASDIQSFVEHFEPNVREIAEVVSQKDFYKISNGWQWQIVLLALSEDRLLSPGHAIQFVERRIASEQQSIKDIREALSVCESKDNLASAIAAAINHDGDIPESIIETGVESWAALLRGEGEHLEPAVIRWLHYARVDFYYQLLCQFSLDMVVVLREAPNFPEIKSRLLEQGPFSDMGPGSQESESGRPFERLLNQWRVLLGVEEPLSWRALARFMPVPSDSMPAVEAGTQRADDLEAAVYETQRRRLYEWRDGTVPQPEQLRAFVENLLPAGYDLNLSVMKARISLAWGAFMDNEIKLASVHDGISNDELGCLLGSFGSYWDKFRGQAAEIAA